MSAPSLPGAKAVYVHDDLDALSVAVAQRIADLATGAIAKRGVFRLALAGGETPRRCYEHLRRCVIDWTQVEVYFGDERCLPRGAAGRNDAMAAAALLRHVPIPPERVHAIPAELGARQAAAVYAALLENGTPFDLVLLGMGEDGHTASLFPGHAALDSPASVVPVFDAPKPPAERVSLGLRTLNAARERILLVAGGAKRAALASILRGADLPAARIVQAEWHVDRAAWPDDPA